MGADELPYTLVPSTSSPSTPSEVLNYASVIAAIVTWFIIVGAVLILLRKLFICFFRSLVRHCSCAQRLAEHRTFSAVFHHACCVHIDNTPPQSSDVSSVSENITAFLPPTYDIALNMPKPDKSKDCSTAGHCNQLKIDMADYSADNRAFELNEARDPDLPTYNDALHLQQTATHFINSRNSINSRLSTIAESVVEIEPNSQPNSLPQVETTSESVNL